MYFESKIIKYALFASLIGLIGLYITSYYLEPEYVPISKIDESYLNKVIKTEGYIAQITNANNSTLFIKLNKDGAEILVVKFNSKENSLKKGDNISVTGEVRKYGGKLEIISREIKKL